MPLSRLAVYEPQTSWDNSGNYDGDYDNLIADIDGDAGIVITRGRDQARGRGTGRVASSEHTLNNTSRRYSAEYPGSPLQDQLLPGRPHRIGAAYGGGVVMDDGDATMDDAEAFMDGVGSVYLFTGTIDDIEQQPALGVRRVNVRALGSLQKLQGRRISTPLYENITTGQAVQYALTAGGLAASEYDIDSDMIANGRTLSYWYADDEDLDAVINRLVFDTEGYPAAKYERGDGVIAIEGRNYRTLADRSQTVQASFYDTSASGDALMDDAAVKMDDHRVFMDGRRLGLYHTGLRYTPGIRDVINAATQEIVIRTAQPLGVVWSYSQTVTLDNSGAATVIAKPTNPFKSAVVPVVSTDFTLSTGTVMVSLSRTSGGSTAISFSGGTAGATITGLQLRAVEMKDTSTVRVTNQLDMSDSQDAYGERSVQLSAWPGLTVGQAQSLCDGIVFAYGEPRPLIEFDVVNGSGRILHHIMTREVSDRVRVVEFHTGIDLEVTIEQITHRIVTGRIHTATFSCEKVVEADWAKYDVSLYGTGIYGQ
jgi:hypothetical protein